MKSKCHTDGYVKQGQTIQDDVTSGLHLLKLETLGYVPNGISSETFYRPQKHER